MFGLLKRARDWYVKKTTENIMKEVDGLAGILKAAWEHLEEDQRKYEALERERTRKYRSNPR